jgi:hypothetical protein
VFNISTTLWMREEYQSIPVKVLIDSDPMYTQAGIPDYLAGTASEKDVKNIDHMKMHDRFFSFAENFGKDGCIIPKGVFDWQPTRQPIVLECWDAPRRPAGNAFTTVLSWQPKESGPVIGGVQYGGKNMEFAKFIDLPGKTEATLELARWLEAQPQVARVFYPGLPSHPQHALAMRQQSGCGGAVLSFEVKAPDAEAARQRAFHVLDSMQVVSLCTNLGDTKTLAAHPASTSHGRLSEVQRQAAGISQGLIRVAVGLDHIEDLKTDLARGLLGLELLK